jgi:hypothetical protein
VVLSCAKASQQMPMRRLLLDSAGLGTALLPGNAPVSDVAE